MFLTAEHDMVVKSYLEDYDIETSEEQRRLLLMHLDLVVEKNKVMNLTRIVNERDAIIRHLVDSLLLYRCIPRSLETDRRRFVDVGTGAGFPGIPLGVVSGWHGTLIDSVGKKARAVNEFISALGLAETLNAEAIRAEDLARRDGKQFDVVTARAVADLGALLEYASPLVKRSGVCIFTKAQISKEEIVHADRVGELVGFDMVSRETFELPEQQGHREVFVYEKQRKSKVKLPRQNGAATSKPLARR